LPKRIAARRPVGARVTNLARVEIQQSDNESAEPVLRARSRSRSVPGDDHADTELTVAVLGGYFQWPR